MCVQVYYDTSDVKDIKIHLINYVKNINNNKMKILRPQLRSNAAQQNQDKSNSVPNVVKHF